MDITPSSVHRSRSRSRSRTRNLTANSRSTLSSRRPSLSKRLLLSGTLQTMAFTPSALEILSEKVVPTIAFTLDNTLPLDFLKQELVGLIKALKISKWHKRQLVASNMLVTRISGALTNCIYKIEYKDALVQVQLPLLLLRVYGKNVDSLIDRESELKTLVKLSAKKIGPKLLGIFCNGRFEQFLEGFFTLGKEEIRDPVISQMIGRRMKDLHYKIDLDGADRELELPVAWIQIMKWLLIFENELLPMFPDKRVVEEVVMMPWPRFRLLVFEYRDWLFSKYDQQRFTDNYRFCHNDTQYGNLLLKNTFDAKEVIQAEKAESDAVGPSTSNKRDRDLAVIDFEYSGANFAAYDIADHFSEWMADYHHETMSYYIFDDKYPLQLEQLNLIKSYVEYDFVYPLSNLVTSKQLDCSDTDVATLVEFETKKMYNEVIYWRSSVQMFWLIWGLIQGGPPKDVMEELGSKSEGKGINSTYNFSTGVEALEIVDESSSAIVDDADAADIITSSDDDFDFFKYSQQKAGLIIGDMVSFGLLNISEVPAKFHNSIKFLDTQKFDV